MPDSDSSTSTTKRWLLKIVRPFSGKAGQNKVKSEPKASSNESATGPILPSSVESNVEQYLKKICRAPARRSQASASRLVATALAAGIVRLFCATTTASASG